MNAGGDPITKCPMCRYDLSGLPKNHQCPECGFEYDETMRVWYVRKTTWWTNLLLLLVYLIGVFSLLDISILGISTPTTTSIYLQVGAVLGILAFTAGYYYIIRKSLDPRTPFMVVTPEKFILGGYGQLINKHAWTTIWIPDPDKLIELPPWEHPYNEQLNSKRKYRFFNFLYVNLGGCKLGIAIYVPPTKALGIKPTVIYPNPVYQLPRRKRKIAVQKIYQIWREANNKYAENITESAEQT